MSEADAFHSFLARVRAGDPSAAEELVRLYEPVVRRAVRMHLVDSRMARLYDSMDFSQSVMASFFVRASGGQYELQEPNDLVRLLVSMAKNKLASSARKQLSQKRDGQRRDVEDQVLNQAMDRSDSPSLDVSMRELIDEARRRLTGEEAAIADLRNLGKTWDEIAQELGGNAQARRMQLARAMDRVSASLGLDSD
jgi:RNA polymerase sigma factor (sigma-70 family)